MTSHRPGARVAPTSRSRLRLLLAGAAGLALLVSGCAFYPHTRAHRSGSVVAFLFPQKQPAIQTASIPALSLPLRVGIAFVPEAPGRGTSTLSEQGKQLLLQRVADKFHAQPFVHEIEVVPGPYLRPGGSFTNLEQIRSMLGVDVIVLVSYDQVQFTEANIFSLAYWTIVGAYVFNGNRNDTHTLMEATVYDIASHSLLFRAPGVDQTKASTSLAYIDGDLRKDSGNSFARATDDLIKNLDTSLAGFRQRVKEGRSNVQITRRPGYTGGALDPTTVNLILVAALATATLYARRHLRPSPPRLAAPPINPTERRYDIATPAHRPLAFPPPSPRPALRPFRPSSR